MSLSKTEKRNKAKKVAEEMKAKKKLQRGTNSNIVSTNSKGKGKSIVSQSKKK